MQYIRAIGGSLLKDRNGKIHSHQREGDSKIGITFLSIIISINIR